MLLCSLWYVLLLLSAFLLYNFWCMSNVLDATVVIASCSHYCTVLFIQHFSITTTRNEKQSFAIKNLPMFKNNILL